jgi:8-oxo-dGTP pyrophosphatase MutT (NUDIX family)
MSSPKDWKVLETKEIFKTGFYRLRSDRCELPDKRVMPNYYVMEFQDWVNVIPITSDNQVVLIEQYRHAIGRTTLEFPGGTLDPQGGETPEQAALRELIEETGYVPEDLRYVGKLRPNPAIQNNFLHTFVALGCQRTMKQNLDPFEDIHVVTRTIPQVLDASFDGEIEHSLMIASLFKSLRFLGFHLP